ncbi:hypothetical protein [Paractinoplanes rishiriensis]|uniref:hypothetical protein n=1 Tax=Paractinoplanes rishiriensis TaxID=1050105 RepID=UPI001942B633|nr:hypothetical protein [Actinoplanes rishiriensis]
MPAIAVPAFALAWWGACYLIGRDPCRARSARAAAALAAYAIGLVAWTIAPASAPAQILFCVPALFWAGTAVALLPRTLPERRQIDVGWLVLSVVFLAVVIALPSAGRLVALAPLLGGLVLLWRFRDQVQPPVLPLALTVVAVLYAVALAVVLLPVDVGGPDLVLAAMGVDLLMLGFLVAVADALEVGERLRPHLIRAVLAAVAVTVPIGAAAVLTIVAVPDRRDVLLLQFGVVATAMTGLALAGRVRRILDTVAFRSDERLHQDRAALLLLADALPRHRQRHRLITTDRDDFLRFTRQALDNYDNLGRLMRSPLTDLPAVDRRLGALAAEQPLARALELRAVLAESVDRLRPAGKFDTSDEWRHYSALYFCVILGLDPYERRPRTEGLERDARLAVDWMRRNVSRPTLRRWQSEAAAIVSRRLWDELMGADPRWLTRARTPTRST